MATSSEIQVTEAYIGLLGRAPDPAGLAYWTAELDAAIAAGEDPAVALKKLTNDITLSDEWDSGIGANDGSTEAGSEAIVTSMYDNLFDRTVSQAELDYWAPKMRAIVAPAGRTAKETSAITQTGGEGFWMADPLVAAMFIFSFLAGNDSESSAARCRLAAPAPFLSAVASASSSFRSACLSSVRILACASKLLPI